MKTLKLTFVLILLVSSFITLMAQCPDMVEITTNTKCARLTWSTAPAEFPQSITLNSDTYSLVTGTSNPAQYTNDGSPNANGCNNYVTYTGDVFMNGNTCTYESSILVGSSVLPVEMKYVEARLDDERGVIAWGTASELNNRGFEIERSADGLRWEDIAWVDGAGTSTEENHYSFIDNNLNEGNNYYRLKQVDFDGEVNYSQLVSIYVETSELDAVGVFPNPSYGQFSLTHIDDVEVEKVELYNQLGGLVMSEISSDNDYDVSGINSGIYTMVLHSNNKKVVKRLIIK